jgi:Na+/melibiose symporter-like transporter
MYYFKKLIGAPFGVGLSYLIGIISKDLEPNDWRFTMRVTPLILSFVLILVIFAYREPKRNNLLITNTDVNIKNEQNSFKNDLKVIISNKTYILITICWICTLGSLG